MRDLGTQLMAFGALISANLQFLNEGPWDSDNCFWGPNFCKIAISILNEGFMGF